MFLPKIKNLHYKVLGCWSRMRQNIPNLKKNSTNKCHNWEYIIY